MCTAWSKSFIVIGVSLIATVQGFAQPLSPQTESIESLVANADLVFIATLEKFGDGDRATGREVHQATIVIEETLKKDLFNEYHDRLSIYIPAPASVLADWQERSCRLLVAHRSDEPKETTVMELAKGKLEVMRDDMTLLRNPDDVIKAAREAVRRMPLGVKRVHTFRLSVPRELVGGTTWEPYYGTGGHLRLVVPVDMHLEKRAQDYLRSENYMKRAEGVRALRYFKSDANIARVKALLTDPGHVIRQADKGEGQEAFYVVRYEAYETLKAWRIDVKEPVIHEDVPK